MLPLLARSFGNASSQHAEGRKAREAVETARAQVAALLNADANEIIFTGSGTEADNLALIGAVRTGVGPEHVITSPIEHAAILKTCEYLEESGVSITHLPVDSDGLVDTLDLEAALRPETRIVSVMAASNLVGTIQPIHELAEITNDHGALFHTDAVQAGGKIAIDVKSAPLDLVSLSAHKLHGPKGIGALFVRRGLELAPIVFGGGQERGLRSATENVAAIVGFGIAAEIALEEMAAEAMRLRRLCEKILRVLAGTIPHAYIFGHPENRLPGHLSLGFAGQERLAGKLVHLLDKNGVAVSAGSACNAHHADKPSHVLLAMGYDAERARGLVRITLGRFNTEAEVDRFLDILPSLVAELNPDLDWTTSPLLAGPLLVGTSM
jgi:cysteine desulfurase